MPIFDPNDIQTTLTTSSAVSSELTLHDVERWLDSATCPLSRNSRRIYKRCVRRAAKLMRKRLEEVPASSETLLETFSLGTFHRGFFKSVDAMIAFRRSLSAAINGATGVTSEKCRLRSREDSWKKFIRALEEVAKASNQSLPFHEKKIISFSVLAGFSRRLNLEVDQLDREGRGALLAMPMSNEQKHAIEDSFRLLTLLRAHPSSEITRLLPASPIEKVENPHQNLEMTAELENEVAFWIDIAARGEWSETDEDYVQDRSQKPLMNAARKILETLHATGNIDIANLPSIAFAFEKQHIISCVRTWRTWSLQGDRRAILPKTADDYLHSLLTLLEKNGEPADFVRKIIRTDSWIATHSSSGSKMTKKNMEFSRGVVTKRPQRLRFQSLHVGLRLHAQWHLNMAKGCRGKEAANHIAKAIQIGTCAAFAALETDASPLRASTALKTTFRGSDAWLDLGHDKASDGHLFVPAAVNKNKKAISAPILATSKLRGLATLRWFEKEVRPLFEASPDNDYLFPAIKNKQTRLPYATLLKWWKTAMLLMGFPGMTPHMFRHGQASIIAARHPGRWDVISARLGDTEDTCRAYYAWINDEQLVLFGQQVLTEEMPYADAA